MTALAIKPGYEKVWVRGRPTRRTELKEEFQAGVIHAIAGAAGCVAKTESIDTGIDVTVTHETKNVRDRLTINLQLKCTEKGNATDEFVKVKVSKQRYDDYRFEGKHEPLILVAQLVHPDMDEWVGHEETLTHLSARNYWINLTGAQPSTVADGGDVIVNVPTANVFDDAALVELFALHRRGELPL
ncbi:DUF4365 domain-containing protein [Corynebacterium sp. MSK105]|uniref:DUF4365 domain-containing protein n=1 Tax=unclassified Corynebacterium TaxID=2624378 RepID=UPI00254E5669|nr:MULTISPECIES: DUF4365 domain-containing protein [unclassified Corynebacterium]MDK8483683.1 DUF4365 domain-containing protein [Corynebacterium sp. MSK074]MDK8691118.1 DUF4365 domain-containing protein [Corynebacterium sp. MSK105]